MVVYIFAAVKWHFDAKRGVMCGAVGVVEHIGEVNGSSSLGWKRREIDQSW